MMGDRQLGRIWSSVPAAV